MTESHKFQYHDENEGMANSREWLEKSICRRIKSLKHLSWLNFLFSGFSSNFVKAL